MRIDPLRGRLGQHRFHPMLVHFPVALYPFSLAMYWLSRHEPSLADAGQYAHAAAVAVSIIAVIYGTIDLLQIDSQEKAWRTGIIHAGLNACWFLIFSVLLIFRIKHPQTASQTGFLLVMAGSTLGVFVSNYFGAELIIRHRIGIANERPPHHDGPLK